MIHIESSQHYESVLQALPSDTVVVIDWFAPWCGPCRAIAPHLETLAKTYTHTCAFLSIDTENERNKSLSPTPKITAFPTFEVFLHRNTTKFHQRFEGANIQKVEALIAEALQKSNSTVCITLVEKPLSFHSKSNFPSSTTVYFKPNAPVSNLLQTKTGRNVFLFAKRVVHDKDVLKPTLHEWGFAANQKHTVVVIPLPPLQKLKVRLQHATNSLQFAVVEFSIFATCQDLLAEAARFSRTQDVRVIYMGKVVDANQEGLLSRFIQGDFVTILCLPGSVSSVETKDGMTPPPVHAKNNNLKEEEDDDDIYSLPPIRRLVAIQFPDPSLVSPLLLQAEELYKQAGDRQITSSSSSEWWITKSFLL